jgi:cell division protein FtsB
MSKRNVYQEDLRRRHRNRRIWTAVLILLGMAYVGGPLLFGEMGLMKYFELRSAQRRLQEEIYGLAESNRKLEREVQSLRSDPDAIERLAREELGLIRDGERVYRFAGK